MPDANRQLVPDHLALSAIAAAILGEWLVPLPLLPPAALANLLSWLGLALALLGLTLEIATARHLHAANTSTRPNTAPQALVTTGPFRWSRNPLYLGLLLVLGGVMLAFALDWLVVVMPLLWLGLDRLIVPGEERMLQSAFAAEWPAYAARTRRWL